MRGLLYQEPQGVPAPPAQPQGLLGALGANPLMPPARRTTHGGVPIREPYPSELDFFKRSGVPAYSSEDGAVVFSPFVNLSPDQRKSLEMNEAARVWMKANKFQPSFSLSASQQGALSGTHYANASEEDRRATTLARLLSGDPSAGQATPEQDALVRLLRHQMGIK
jgi:hypothetical protein